MLFSLLRRRTVRYALVSVVSVAVAQVTLATTFGVLHWEATHANIVATAVGTVPSYSLNRAWVWGKHGRSHLLKEVAPFWALTLLGLGLSTLVVALGERWAVQLSGDRLVQTGIVSTSALLGFGVVWVGKFVVLHHILFAPPRAEAEPVAAPESA